MMQTYRYRILLAMAVGLAGLEPAAAQAPAPPPDAPPQVPLEQVESHGRLHVRLTGDYGPFAVTWTRRADLPGVSGVFTHPGLPDVVVLVTDNGLLRSDDAGASWQPLPDAQALGPVTHVSFAPESAEVLLAASTRQGVWRSDDGGRSWERIGSTQTGLAANAVAAVQLDPADPWGRTLLAIHGDAAPGISRSDDGGRSWHVIAEGYHIHLLLLEAPGRLAGYMVGASASAPDVLNLYYSVAPGRYWTELAHDVLITDAALGLTEDTAWFASADAGIHRVSHQGGLIQTHTPAGAQGITSLAVTWGASADQPRVLAYEPTRLGLVHWRDDPAGAADDARGLLTGPFVREGARLRANANGSALFLVANRELFHGQPVTMPLAVRNARVEPACIEIQHQSYLDAMSEARQRLARQAMAASQAVGGWALLQALRQAEQACPPLRGTVRAEVAGLHPDAARAGEASVTVDLSRLGLSPRTPMHHDPASHPRLEGAVVYTATFELDPDRLAPQGGDWRRRWPGPLGLTVSAVDADGALAGEVAVATVLDRPGPVVFWNADQAGRSPRHAVGGVTATIVDQGSYIGRSCLRIDAPAGAWEQPFGSPWGGLNLTGYHALSFRLRADRPDAPDLRVHLRDSPTYLLPATTPGLGLRAHGLLEGDAFPVRYGRVVVPLESLTAQTQDLQLARLGWVVFSGEGGEPATFWIDDIRFYPDAQSLQADLAADQGEFPHEP